MVQTISQTRIAERIDEQIVDVLRMDDIAEVMTVISQEQMQQVVFHVPQIKEEIVKAIPPVPLERIHERDVERTLDFLVPHIKEKIWEYLVEQVVDVPMPEVFKESLEVVRFGFKRTSASTDRRAI